MKIYTKTGDKGMTSLLGGSRVSKSNIRIDSYGTIDELNSHLGLLKDYNIALDLKKIIKRIQHDLFDIGAYLACEVDPGKYKLHLIEESDIHQLEIEIDQMEMELQVLNNFILPGGHQAVSQSHIARCVCRRAERKVTYLSEQQNIPLIIVRYLNRLSDFLFVLSRRIAKDFGVEEEKWQPRHK